MRILSNALGLYRAVSLRHVIAAAGLFSISGCASDLVKIADVDTAVIQWVRVQPKTCDDMTARGLVTLFACTRGRQREGKKSHCIIEMPEDADDRVVAEEFRHCFLYEHKKEI